MAIKSGMVPRDQLQPVLSLLQEARRMDFAGYKRSTLQRRIEHRMRERKCFKVGDYCDLLRQEPAEIDTLVSALLIKVTEFFRDPPTWEMLREKAIPEILAHTGPGDEIRIWSAGCATGEEAYSIAMLMAELMSQHPEYSSLSFRVFGTDRDATAIVAARRGVFTRQQIESLDQRLIERWFEPIAERYAARKELRRFVVFGVQDVVNDAPISRLDLILCRNVFIYLDVNSQRRALLKFHHALKPGGLLVLGKSELVPGADKLFTQVDLATRVYRKLIVEPRATAYSFFEPVGAPHRPETAESAVLELSNERLAREALSVLGVAVVVVSKEGIVTAWNQPATQLFGRTESEVIGKPLSGIKFAGVAGEHLLERAVGMRSGHMAEETFEIDENDSHRAIRFVIRPLMGAQGLNAYLCIAQDVTELNNAINNLRVVEKRENEMAEKYKSAINELQSTNEELETTNEELQSANEELQTTNEELQSTNEELETINEELESTNASFDAVNKELNIRSEELTRLSLSQRAIIEEISTAIIAFDPQDRVELWNPAAEILFRRTENQVKGQPLQRLSLSPLPRSVINRLKVSLRRKNAMVIPPFDCIVHGHKIKFRCSLTPLVSDSTYHGIMLIIELARASRLLRIPTVLGISKPSKNKKGGSSTS